MQQIGEPAAQPKMNMVDGQPGRQAVARQVDRPLGINWAAEQAAFERWYLATQSMKNYARLCKRLENGVYVDRLVRIAWRAWIQGVKRSTNCNVAVDA